MNLAFRIDCLTLKTTILIYHTTICMLWSGKHASWPSYSVNKLLARRSECSNSIFDPGNRFPDPKNPDIDTKIVKIAHWEGVINCASINSCHQEYRFCPIRALYPWWRPVRIISWHPQKQIEAANFFLESFYIYERVPPKRRLRWAGLGKVIFSGLKFSMAQNITFFQKNVKQ